MILYNEICHTPLQVSKVHLNQAGVESGEEIKWCIRETATATPLKKTQDLSFKSWYKPRFKGAATNINGTPQQPWIKREGDLDGDLYHCTWSSKLTDDIQNNTETKGTPHVFTKSGKTLSHQTFSILVTFESTTAPDQAITHH